MSLNRAFQSSNWRVRTEQKQKYETHWSSTCGDAEPRTASIEYTSNNRIYVGNMPYTAQRKDVEKLFEDERFEVANIDISIDAFTFRNPSYCFVDLLSTEDANLAIQTLSGKPFLGRPLKVRPCDQKRTKGDRQHSDRLVSNRWKSSAQQHSQRQHAKSFDRSMIDLPAPIRERRRVYVANLPKPVDNHASDLLIRGLFGNFDVEAVSKVKWPCEEMMDMNGWYVFVDFRSADEAHKAIAERKGVRLGGERLVVAIANGVPEKVVREMYDSEYRGEGGRSWRLGDYVVGSQVCVLSR